MSQGFSSAFKREVAFLRSSFVDRAMLFLIPLVLVAIVSAEMAGGVMRDLPVAIVDQDGTSFARELSRRIDASPSVEIISRSADIELAERLMRERKIYALVVIPAEARKRALHGETGTIPVLYNASYSTPSSTAVRGIGDAIQSYARDVAMEQSALVASSATVRPPPIAPHTTILFNPQASYELQLVGLLWPAILHLIFMVAIVSALGRELRDGTVGEWLSSSRRVAAMQVLGKLAPYVISFMVWAIAANAYLSVFRGWPIAGSPAIILIGYLAMYLAYAGVAILLVGLTRSMAQSLSITGIFAGASFAFSGAIFPVESASSFAQVWSVLLPYTAFAKLWAEQFVMGTSIAFSLRQVLVMLAFVLFGLVVGLPRYVKAASEPEAWGKR